MTHPFQAGLRGTGVGEGGVDPGHRLALEGAGGGERTLRRLDARSPEHAYEMLRVRRIDELKPRPALPRRREIQVRRIPSTRKVVGSSPCFRAAAVPRGQE